ncbi:MAG: tetratricopeptide repeat protein [Lachnospiraceae bacterium]
MRRHRRRRRNRKDQFGIYEIPEYRPVKKKKKKKQFTLKGVLKLLGMLALLLVIVYGVSFGVKYSMRDKALSLYEKEDYEGAIDLFEEALKPRLPLLENFDNDVRFYLADCYVNTGEYGLACYEYSKIRLWADGEVGGLSYLQNVAYGLQLYDWQEYRSALPILLKAYEDGYSDLVLYVGSCYGQTGDLENMQLYYDVFLQNNEMNSFMYAQYAAIALDEGKLDEAFSYIEAGKQLEDQSNIKELLFDEIVYYEKLKDYNTAYEKAKAFVEAFPNDAGGRNEYDLLYTRQTVSEQ